MTLGYGKHRTRHYLTWMDGRRAFQRNMRTAARQLTIRDERFVPLVRRRFDDPRAQWAEDIGCARALRNTGYDLPKTRRLLSQLASTPVPRPPGTHPMYHIYIEEGLSALGHPTVTSQAAESIVDIRQWSKASRCWDAAFARMDRDHTMDFLEFLIVVDCEDLPATAAPRLAHRLLRVRRLLTRYPCRAGPIVCINAPTVLRLMMIPARANRVFCFSTARVLDVLLDPGPECPVGLTAAQVASRMAG